MQVRHDTRLLEQAIAHAVRRSSIPLLEAEAAAQEKILRATAFRRLATGASVAVVALGIGLGFYLFNRKDSVSIVENTTSELPDTNSATQPEIPASTSVPSESNSNVDQAAPSEPEIVTTDFTIFRNREVPLNGKVWTVVAGHNFATEADQRGSNWRGAYCYTTTPGNKLELKIELGDRRTPNSSQTPPRISAEDIWQSNIGLAPIDVINLANKCPWMDGKSFSFLVSDLPKGGDRSLTPNDSSATKSDTQIIDSLDINQTNTSPQPSPIETEDCANSMYC